MNISSISINRPLLATVFLLMLASMSYAQHAPVSLTDYSVFELDTAAVWAWRVNGTKASAITAEELVKLDSVLKVCIAENSSSSRISAHGRDIGRYDFAKQVVPFENDNGERSAWVNCHCLQSINSENAGIQRRKYRNSGAHDPFHFDWTNGVVVVYDGGNCYWNVLVNLKTLTYSNLYVNGI